MKKSLLIATMLAILLATVSVLFVWYSSPKHKWQQIIAGFEALPDPPQPQITYGEFPFTLVYELNGEVIVLEDTKICEYDGVGVGSNGKYRKWIGRLADSGNGDVFIISDDTREVYCYIGSAGYYMNDEKYPEQRPLTPRIYYVKLNNNDRSILSQAELLEKYNVKLLSWEFTDPVENTFR